MQIVALANLYPAEENVSELDSFMYQTVGHELIQAYAECTGLPLYRRQTRGKSKNQVSKKHACLCHTQHRVKSGLTFLPAPVEVDAREYLPCQFCTTARHRNRLLE